MNDVWTFNFTSRMWTEVVIPGTKPVGRYTSASDIAPNGQFFIFGGYDYSYKNDAWKLDLGTKVWKQLISPAPFPSGREKIRGAFHTSSGYFYLFGGYNGCNSYFV